MVVVKGSVLLEHEISGKDVVFFLHIPKTGGVTLDRHLAAHFRPEETSTLLQGWMIAGEADPAGALARYRYIHGHLHDGLVQGLLHNPPLTLAMFRSPVDRLISRWAFARHQVVSDTAPLRDRQSVERLTSSSLEQFVEQIETGDHFNIANHQTALLGKDFDAALSLQQSLDRFLEPVGEKDLERARQRLPGLVWIGLNERFAESLALLSFVFGWPLPDLTLRLNPTKKRPAMGDIPEELARRLRRVCSLDEVLYADATALFEQRYAALCQSVLERYGGKCQARLKPPLPVDILAPLIEHHYSSRFGNRHPFTSDYVMNFEDIIEGSGWHVPERSPSGELFRWTGPETCSVVYLPLERGHDYVLQLRVLREATSGVLDSLKVDVNGHPLEVLAFPEPHGSTSFRGLIPAPHLENDFSFVRLALHVDRTNSMDTSSERLLGLAVSGLHLRAIT